MSWLRDNISTLITSVLDSYTKSYDKDNLDIALLRGIVHIRNIELKPLSLWDYGIPFETVRSSISHVSVAVPWSPVGESSLRMEVDDVNITLAANYDCKKMTASDNEIKQRRQEKMLRKVLEKEMQLLGIEKSSGFFQKTAMKMGLIFLSRLTKNFQLVVNNLNLQVFLPFDHGYSAALCVQVRFGKLKLDFNTIAGGKSSSVVTSLLNNNFNFSMSDLEVSTEIYRFNPMHFGDRVVEQAVLYRLRPEISSCNLLHKTHLSVESRVDYQSISETTSDPSGQKSDQVFPSSLIDIKARIDFGEVQLTASLEQIMSLSRCLDTYKWGLVLLLGRIERPVVRWQFDSKRLTSPRRFHRDHGISNSWWKYAVNCVIWSIRDKRGRETSSNISNLFARMRNRERYMTLYSMQLSNSQGSSLSSDDMDQFLELHSCFSIDELVLFRAVARKRLSQTEANFNLRLAYNQGNDLVSKNFYSRISSLFRQPVQLNSDDNKVEEKIPKSLRNIANNLVSTWRSGSKAPSFASDAELAVAIQQSATRHSFEIDICVPRVSASFSSSLLETQRPVLLFVSHAVCFGLRNSALSEVSLQFLVGSFRLYGSEGEVIFSCGNLVDIPSDFLKINLNKLVQFASSPFFTLFGISAVYDVFSTSDSSTSKKVKHSVFDGVAQPIRLHWDDSTIRRLLLLQEKFHEMTGFGLNGKFEFEAIEIGKVADANKDHFSFSSAELASLRRVCAELSISDADCELQKTSVNALIQDITLELPCIQGLTALVEINGLHAISGDYVPHHCAEMNFQPDKITELVTSLSNHAVRPLMVSIQCLEAYIEVDTKKHKTLPTQIKLTRTPVQFCMILSRCLIPSHSFLPKLRTDVIGSNLNLSVSPVALFSIISAFYSIKSSLSKYLQGSKSEVCVPRISLLSPLCKLLCKVTFDCLEIEISDDVNGTSIAAELREVFLSSLLEMIFLVESHGKRSLAASHCFDVAILRLSSFYEIDSSQLSTLFQACLNDIMGMPSFDIAFIQEIAKNSLGKVLKCSIVDPSTNIDQSCPIKMLSVSLKTVILDFRKLMYDTSCIFSVQKISVFDIDRLPIFSAVNSSDSMKINRMSTSDSSIDEETFLKMKLQEEAYDMQKGLTVTSAVFITFVSQDHDHSCGQGGSLPTVLHDPELASILAKQRRRENKIVARVGQMSVLISPLGVRYLLESLFEEKQAIGDELERQVQFQSDDVSKDSKIDGMDDSTDKKSASISVSVSIDACEVTLFCEGCLLLDAQFQQTEIDYFCDSAKEFLHCCISNIQCYDLTAAGTRHSIVLWGLRDEIEDSNQYSGDPSLSINVDLSDDKMMNVDINVHGIRACFLNRLISEIKLFWTDKLRESLSVFLSNNKGSDSKRECCWNVCVTDFCLLMPRCSFSDDCINVTVESCLIANDKVEKSWNVPGISNMETTDPVTNNTTWRPSKFNIPGNMGKSHSKSLESSQSESSDDFVSARSSDDDIFYDAVSGIDEEAIQLWKYERISIKIYGARIFCSMRHDIDISFQRKDKLKRKLQWIRSTQILFDEVFHDLSKFDSDVAKISVDPCFDVIEECYPKFYAPVSHGGKIYLDHDYEGVESMEVDIWQELSLEKFDILINFDDCDCKTRILIDFEPIDTNRTNRVRLRLTCEELNLLQSAWFDNWKEINYFCTFELGLPLKHSTEENFGLQWPVYGFPEFIEMIKLIKPSFELAVVCPIIELRSSFEIGKNIPMIFSWKYVNSEAFQAFPRTINPLIHVQIENLLLHVVSDKGLMLVGIEADRIDIDDVRVDVDKALNRVLHASESGVSLASKGGPKISSLDESSKKFDGSVFFGLDMSSGSIVCRQPSKPVKVSVIMPPNDWICVNVYVGYPDIMLTNLDIVWCMVDLFSCYYTDVRFGHPKLNLPPGKASGVDVRVWITKPHAAVLASTDKSGTTALVLEEDTGVYYRWRRDPSSSVRQELRLVDSILMLHRTYTGPNECRGIRGMSGSGKGLRTFIDALSGGMILDYVSPDKIKLLQFCIPLGISEFDKENTIRTLIKKHGFDVPLFSSDLPIIANVTCVQAPLFIERGNENNRACDIVSSIEDILFVSSSLQSFLGWDRIEKPSTESKVVTSGLPQCTKLELTVDLGDDNSIGASNLSVSEQFLLIANVSSVRVIMVDPILGMHLPIAKIFISKANFLQGGANTNFRKQICLALTAYGDYFNNTIKCWEPLFEPLGVHAQTSETRSGCSGITLRALTPIHFNLSTAFIRTLSDAAKLFAPLSAKSPASNRFPSPSTSHSQTIKMGKMKHITRSKPIGTLDFSRQCSMGENWGSGKIKTYALDNPLDDNSVSNQRILCCSPVALRLASQSSMSPEIFSKTFSFRKRQKSWNSSNFVVARDSYAGETTKYSSLSSRRSGRVPTSTVGFDLDGNQSRGIFKHLFPLALPGDSRVGFSLYNLTGLLLRYTQYRLIKGKYCIEYAENGQRCLLSFLATHSVLRDLKPKEVPFVSVHNVRNGHPDVLVTSSGIEKQDSSSGHRLGVQLSGFKWHWMITADALGCRFDSLRCVLGRRSVHMMGDWKVQNCMQLVTDVTRYKGGRLITFRSPFTISNRCDHDLEILAQPSMEQSIFHSEFNPSSSVPVRIAPNGTFHVPLLLLTKSVESTLSGNSSRMPGLGKLFIKPALSSVYMREVSHKLIFRSQSVSISYPQRPFQLFDIVSETAKLFTKLFLEEENDVDSVSCSATGFNVICTSSSISSDVNSLLVSSDIERKPVTGVIGDLPPFCYIVEVNRTKLTPLRSAVQQRENIKKRWLNMGKREEDQTQIGHFPVSYNLSIHPPLIIENLLAESGYFELINVNKDICLWGQFIKSGGCVHIHTVGLDSPLRLMISLSYCRSLVGTIIHHGLEEASSTGGVSSDSSSTSQSDIILTDSIGQKLTVILENSKGGAGQRRIVVFCPYWIVNTSQFPLRFKQEGSSDYPAGTISRNGNGSLRLNKSAGESLTDSVDQNNDISRVFPGCPGLLDIEASVMSKLSREENVEYLLSNELSSDVLLGTSYMFNFTDTVPMVVGISNLLGSYKLAVQVQDSEWSEAISLDTVGMDLHLAVNHSSKGNLEVGYKITSAEGKWSSYTRILRFWPRYVLWNKMPSSMRLFQALLVNSTIDDDNKAKQPIVQASSSKFKPFHLPDVQKNRELCFQMSGGWKSSTTFNIDIIKDYTFKTMRTYDYRVDAGFGNTNSSEYVVIVPPECAELGLWFETDWSHEWVIVKSMQAEGYAAKFTDISVGDLLLDINSEPVEGLPFDDVVKLLKSCLVSRSTIRLHFLTVEERLRRIRLSAVTGNKSVDSKELMECDDIEHGTPNALVNKLDKSFFSDKSDYASFDARCTPSNVSATKQGLISRLNRLSSFDDSLTTMPKSSGRLEDRASEYKTHLSVRSVGASILLTVSPAEEIVSEYRIENNCIDRIVYVRQVDCYHYPWTMIAPSSKMMYTWEDPTISKKVLLVSMSYPITLPSFSAIGNEDSHKEGLFEKFSRFSIAESKFDETASKVPFDEIGFHSTISFPEMGEIGCRIDSDGPTKVLMLSHSPSATKHMVNFNSAVCNQLISKLLELEKMLEKCQKNDSTQANIDNQTMDGSYSSNNMLQHIDDNLCKDVKEIFGRHITEIFFSSNRSKARRNDPLNFETLGKQIGDDASDIDSNFFENQYSGSATNNIAKEGFVLASSLGLGLVGSSAVADQYWHPVVCPNATSVNTLIVEVMEARELRASDIKGFSDPYSVISFKANDKSSFKPFLASKQTYYCSKTLCPVWSGQRFIFSVPEAATLAPSLFWIKVKIKDHDIVGFRENLGETQIRLSLLMDEKEKEGWFRLSPRSKTQTDTVISTSSIGETLDDDNRGAVKLKMRWVNTFKGLMDCRLEELKKKIYDLRHFSFSWSKMSESMLSNDFNDFSLSSYPKSAKNVFRRAGEGLIRTGDKFVKVTSDAAESFRNQLKRIDSEAKIDVEYRVEENSFDLQQPTRPRHRRASFSNSINSPYKLPIFANSNPTIDVPTQEPTSAISHSHRRSPSKEGQIQDALKLEYFRNQALSIFSLPNYIHFMDCFLKEDKRSIRQLTAGAGIVRIRPLQADFLPVTNSSIYIKISYGTQDCQTLPIPPSASPDWSHLTLNSSVEADQARISSPNIELIDWEFVVDLLNISGNFRVSVFAYSALGMHKEISRIEISPFSILDCCVRKDFLKNMPYVEWFPLLDPDEMESHDGDLGLSSASWSSEKSEHLQMDRRPCLRLQLEWSERESIAVSKSPNVFESEEKKSGASLEESIEESRKTRSLIVASLLSQISFWSKFGFSKLLRFARVSIPGVSATIIDSDKSLDLMYISISGIEARFGDAEERSIAMATISWCQVDNPSPICQSPVILSPILLPLPQPVIRAAIIKNNSLSHGGLICVEKIAVLIQTLQLSLEQSSVLDIWDWIGEVTSHSKSNNASDLNVADNNTMNLLSSPSRIEEQLTMESEESSKRPSAQTDTKLYIDTLSIGPVKVYVSFLTSSLLTSRKTASSKKQDMLNASRNNEAPVQLKTTASKMPGGASSRRHRQWALVQVGYGIGSSLINFGRLIGEVILDLTSSISDAPIKLNSLEIDNLFNTNREVTRILQDHYLGSMLGEIYKIVGSLDLVGNPIGLVSSLGTGVRDFFYEPALGLITSPHAFGQGVVKGTLSLVSNTTSGVVGAATKITRSFGKGAAALSMDKPYLQTRERISKREIGRGRYGEVFRLVPRPLYDLYFGVQHAVTGVFMNPIDGYRSNGVYGLIGGTALGIAGLAVKPVVGVLDAATHTGETLGTWTRRVGLETGPGTVFRRRLSSIFGPDGRLMNYSPEVARGQQILQSNEEQFAFAFTSDESVVIVRRIQVTETEDLMVIVTTKRLAAVSIHKNRKQVVVAWEVNNNELCDKWKGFNDSCLLPGVSRTAMGPCELIISTSLQLLIHRKAASTVQSNNALLQTPNKLLNHINAANRMSPTNNMGDQIENRSCEIISGEFHDLESFSTVLNVICASQRYWEGILHTTDFNSFSRSDIGSGSVCLYGSGSPCFVTRTSFNNHDSSVTSLSSSFQSNDFITVKAGSWDFIQPLEFSSKSEEVDMFSHSSSDESKVKAKEFAKYPKRQQQNNIRALEAMEWFDSSLPSLFQNSLLPQWLITGQTEAKACHAKILSIEKLIESLETSKDATISSAVVKFYEGQLSEAEFCQMIDAHVDTKRRSMAADDIALLIGDGDMEESKFRQTGPSILNRIISAGRDLELSQTLLDSARMVTSAIKERAAFPLKGLRKDFDNRGKSSDDDSVCLSGSDQSVRDLSETSRKTDQAHDFKSTRRNASEESFQGYELVEKLEARVRELESKLDRIVNTRSDDLTGKLIGTSGSASSSASDQAENTT